MRNSSKAVFVKPWFCMRVFTVKKRMNREILLDIRRNSLKTMFVKARVHGMLDHKKVVQSKDILTTLFKGFKYRFHEIEKSR